MRSLPIFRACVRTCRYLLSRAATPTVSLSPTPATCVVACDIATIVPARFTPCAGSLGAPGLCAQFATEGVFRNVVDKGLRAVDLHDGKELAVTLLEVGIVRDVDLAQLEAQLLAQPVQDRAGALAQVAAGRVVEDDVRDTGRAWWSPRRRAGRRGRMRRGAWSCPCSRVSSTSR